MFLNSVIAEVMRPNLKRFIHVVNYNSDSNSDLNNDIESDVDLTGNKLSVRQLANNSITHNRKRHIVEMKEEVNKALKVKATQEKRISVKYNGKNLRYQSLFLALLINPLLIFKHFL